MCLINLHYQNHSKYRLIVVANRDEDYCRPSKEAYFWDDAPSILAGRDLLQMGTWLGVSKDGRFAAITNFRDPSLPERPKSRGEIVKRFLLEESPINDFINELTQTRELYGGYNVLLGDESNLVHYNNILNEVNVVSPGTHSLSNHSFNSPWPKVEKGRSRLQKVIQMNQKEIPTEELFCILADETKASDQKLPNTGVGLELERLLSPLFIRMPHYGTRASTIVLIDHDDNLTFIERTFHNGKFQFDTKYEFNIEKVASEQSF